MIHVKEETCIGCGACGTTCPRHLLEVVDQNGSKKSAVCLDRVDLCMRCGHCAAVCPTSSVSVDGMGPDAFGRIEPLQFDSEQMLSLLRRRRSVRRYKDAPVPRGVLDRIIDAVHCAPTGTGSISTGVIVIDHRERIAALMEHVYAIYEKLDQALGSKIGRFVVKRKIGDRKLRTLQDFVMPGMRWYLRWYRGGTSDEISRDCPALMLFHGPVYEPMVENNCTIAAFHAVLMAEALGVGTCFNHLIPPACNRSPKIRELLQLPDGREVYDSLTLGYPRFRWRYTVLHRLADVRYLD